MRAPFRMPVLPFHWKLTISSAILLCALIAVSNVTQFVFVERWMMKQEEQRMQRDMRELLNILLAEEIEVKQGNEAHLRLYMERLHFRNGMIRLLTDSGAPVIIVADNMPQEMIYTSIETDKVTGSVHYEDGMLVMRSPITIFSFQGTIEMIRSMEDVERLIKSYYNIMVICCLAALLLSGLGGRLLARGLVRPLRSMNAAMRNVKQRGLHERMPVTGTQDEIAALQTMFNGMMDQVEESFLQQRRFVEDASHELRTPLAIMEGHLRLLSRWGKDDPTVTEQSLRISMEELQRLKKLVDDLLQLSRAEQTGKVAGEQGTCDRPQEVLQDAVWNMNMICPDFDFRLEGDRLNDVRLTIAPQELSQVIRILLDNAVKYSGDRKSVLIRTKRESDCAVIAVEDQGIGVSEEDLPRIWDRFYRADKVRNGSAGGYGLGLSIAKSLVANCGGTITMESSLGQGTKVVVALPLA